MNLSHIFLTTSLKLWNYRKSCWTLSLAQEAAKIWHFLCQLFFCVNYHLCWFSAMDYCTIFMNSLQISSITIIFFSSKHSIGPQVQQIWIKLFINMCEVVVRCLFCKQRIYSFKHLCCLHCDCLFSVFLLLESQYIN